VVLPEGKTAPRLGGSQKPLSRGFVSNLKDFLTERPIKINKNVKGDVFTVEEYGGGLTENFKEWFKPTPKAVSSRMTVDWQPAYKVMWQNLRDLISPPKLPPLKVTSQPVKVKDMVQGQSLRAFTGHCACCARWHHPAGLFSLPVYVRCKGNRQSCEQRTKILKG